MSYLIKKIKNIISFGFLADHPISDRELIMGFEFL